VGMIELQLEQGESASIAAAALPILRHLVAAAAEQQWARSGELVLARALWWAGFSAEAEERLRGLLDVSVATSDFECASVVATHLADVLRDTGRAEDALRILDLCQDYTRRAGRGRWTQVFDIARRLQLLIYLGRHKEALEQAVGLLE